MPDSLNSQRKPRYPRTREKLAGEPRDPMELPRLFSGRSPWNQIIAGSDAFPNGVISETDNMRIMLVAFDIMREFSWEALAKDYKRRDELALREPFSDPVAEAARLKHINDLTKKICRQHLALEVKEGLDQGGIQTPSVGCVDYAFPIFPVRREGEIRSEVEVRLRTYHGESWEPTYTRRRSEGEFPNKTWIAEGVPLPAGVIRPAGPESDVADGCVILYDDVEHEEWDFFQVSTSHDPLKQGGGQEGTEMLAAGSLARFDTQGDGARLPPDGEPLGSSRATGLPYLGGLLVPEDFKDGENSVIKHALAFTFPRSRYFPFQGSADPPDFIYPAVKSETSHFIQNPFALAAGMRIRLKSIIQCVDGRELPQDQWVSLPHAVRIFFTALHDYGAYLVDGAFGFGFVAEDRETAVIDPGTIPTLLDPGQEIDVNCTPWESLIQTIDDYLSYKLFPGLEQPDQSYSRDQGLSLGWLKRTSGQYTFQTNFEVVAPLEVPH